MDKSYEIMIDSFYGGMGDVRTMMQPYEFLYWEQIDWYRNPEYLTLTRWLKAGFSTWTNLMLCACEWENNWVSTNLFFAWEGGKIYCNGVVVWTLTDGSAKTIYNMARFDDKILMFYVYSPGVMRLAYITLANATTWANSRNANIQVNKALWIGFPTITIPNWQNYFPYVIVDSYLWFTCGKQIGRISIGSMTSYLSGSVALWIQTIVVEDSSWYRVWDVITITGSTFAIGTITAIPNWNQITLNITQAWVWVVSGSTVSISAASNSTYVVSNTKIELEDNVVGLTRVWPLFHIYLSNGKTYLWDWFSDTAEAGLDFRNTVRFVSNKGKIDYAATGGFPRYGWFYQADWYDFKLLKPATNEEELGKIKYQVDSFNPGGNDVMTEYNSNLYYSCIIDTPSWDGHAIATYGHYYDWFPNQHTIEYIYPEGSTEYIEDIGMIHKWLNGASFVYFSSRDFNGDCRVSTIDASEEPVTPAFVQTGVYYSRKFDMQDKINKKKLDEMQIMINWWAVGTWTLAVSYALNSSSTFTAWQTLNNTAAPVTEMLVSLWNIPDDFYDIKFKFEIWVLAPTAAPKIYWFTLRWEYVNT